jgi:hypothetical protein
LVRSRQKDCEHRQKNGPFKSADDLEKVSVPGYMKRGYYMEPAAAARKDSKPQSNRIATNFMALLDTGDIAHGVLWVSFTLLILPKLQNL